MSAVKSVSLYKPRSSAAQAKPQPGSRTAQPQPRTASCRGSHGPVGSTLAGAPLNPHLGPGTAAPLHVCSVTRFYQRYYSYAHRC